MINQSTLPDFKLSVFFGQIKAVEGVDVALFLDESSIIISSNAFILLPFTLRLFIIIPLILCPVQFSQSRLVV